MSENPYTSPQAPAQNHPSPVAPAQVKLASRWARLGASLLDGIIMFVIFIPIFAAFFAVELFSEAQQTEIAFSNFALTLNSVIGKIITSVAGVLIYIAINGYFLVKYGQSVGKKIVGTRVVCSETYQLLSFSKIVGIRYVLVTLLTQIPFIGGLFALINALFIFGDHKRCLHDHMAGSIVIDASSI